MGFDQATLCAAQITCLQVGILMFAIRRPPFIVSQDWNSTMPNPARDLARRLAAEAEAVCRHYLSNGRRQGAYWTVGDLANTPGRSLYVRLTGPLSGPGAAGHWTDAATGVHGDLLDLIAANRNLTSLRDTLDEARSFLALPRPDLKRHSAVPGSPEAARRLWALGQPISDTLAARYLAGRGIGDLGFLPALRFHPACYYRRDASAKQPTPAVWPALLAKVTDLQGRVTGLHRTWLDPATGGKAPLIPPRKAMGRLQGHGVRFGTPREVLAVGEGLETVLSLHIAAPALPLIAALSAPHLAQLILPPGLKRLYIAQDLDPAGRTAMNTLADRARLSGITPIPLVPCQGDFNDDLRAHGVQRLREHLRPQFDVDDASHLLPQASA